MRISEVCERCNISADTLRYYERIGLLPDVRRNHSGVRDYSDLDIRRIEFIKCMRSAGLTIQVLIEYYGLVQQGDGTIAARKEILVEQRKKITARRDELQQTLDLLNYKIGVYETALVEKEQELTETEV
jgi:DNA-binding transcriptional MerR regulator